MTNIPIGAFGWWYWEPDDDVAIYIGGNLWMRGSRHVTTRFGGVSRNAGYGSFSSFQSSAKLPFLGWSKTNGGNTVDITTLAPAGMFKDQRKTANTFANVRATTSTKAKITSVLKPDTIYTMIGYANGQRIGGLNLWYVMKDKHVVHCSSFLEPRNADGLRNMTDELKPDPVVPVPVPVPEPVPGPEPTPEPEPAPEPVPEPEPTPEPVEPDPVPEPVEPEPEPEPEPVPVEPDPVKPVPEPEPADTVKEPEVPPPGPWVGLAALITIIASVIAALWGGTS
jgi:hypothetical protein